MAEVPTSTERIHVHLLGGPAVRISHPECALTLHQQILLTAVLGSGRKGISRSKLAWLIWQSDSSTKVRQRIRQLLHRTHSRIGRTILEAEGDTLRGSPTAVRDDFATVLDLMARGDLAEAAGLLSRGPALSLQEGGSEEFTDWLRAKLISLRSELRARAAQTWDQSSEAGLWGAARDAAEALFLLFPDEPAVAIRLIEARARTGSVSSAETILADFLERTSEPGTARELLALGERVRRLKTLPNIPAREAEPRAPLVGRAEELQSIKQMFGEVRAGDFRFTLITGEPGIGKSRVLEAARKEALLDGFRCLHASPVEPEARIPLNVLADAFQDIDLGGHLRALGSPWRAVIGALLPPADDEPIEEAPPIQEAHLSRRLLDALHMLFSRVAQEEPTLLFLDNLQWVDATTLSALQFTQRRWKSGPLGVVAAGRPESIAESERGGDYLRASSGLHVVRIELKELKSDDAESLVRHLTGGAADAETRTRLSRLGGAHPLFITELTRDFLSGRLSLPERIADALTVPGSLQELIDGRLGLCSPDTMRVAGLLAVRAKPMRLAHIADSTGLPIERCADCSEELKRLRLVSWETDRVWISHELFRSAIYRHLSEARRAVLHRAIVNLLAEGSLEAQEGELAIHSARAGDRSGAARHGWIAGQAAVTTGAVSEAAYFFELVVDNEDSPPLRAQATAELARALHLNRAIARANPLLELASARLRETGDPHRARRIDIRHVEGLFEADRAPLSDLLRRLADVKQEAETASDWEAVALALDAELRLAHHRGDPASLRGIFNQMRRVVSSADGIARAVANAGLALEVLYAHPLDALQAAREAVDECPNTSQHRFKVLLRLLLVLHYQGLFFSDEGRSALTEAQRLSKTSGDLLLRFSLKNNIAVAYLDVGDLDKAEVFMAESQRLLGKAELDLNRFNQAINAGELALAQGRYDDAQRLYSASRQYVGHKTPPFAPDLVAAGLGLAALHLGDLTTARQCEAALSVLPPSWYFDPTTIIWFRTLMLRRRQEKATANSLLEQTAENLKGRLEYAWLKVRMMQIGQNAKSDPSLAKHWAQHARDRALELNLEHRVRELDRWLLEL